MKRLFRHLAFYSAWTLWSFILIPVALVFLACPASWMSWLARVWVGGILQFSSFFLNLTYRVQGLQHLPQEGPYLIASKHQSAWETLVFNLLLPHPAFFLKKSLLRIPVLGWCLWKLQMIAVSRSSRRRSQGKFIKAAQIYGVSQKRPLVIFPEGTRTAPGCTSRYRHGVFALYHHFNLKVIPAALNAGVFWGRRQFFKQPGTIDLIFLPPLPPGLDQVSFMHQLTETIERVSQSLLPSSSEVVSLHECK